MILIAVITSLLASLYILPGILGFLKKNNICVRNYRGIPVFNSAGLFLGIDIIIISTSLLIIGYTVGNVTIRMNALCIIIGTLATAFVGYLDDNSSERQKGISGHVSSLLEGKITAGSLKAFMGVVSSLIICLTMEYSGINFILNLLLIPFMQNFINLMDLRPGRAIKTYAVIILIFMPLINFNPIYSSLNAGIIIALFFYLPYEMSEVYMLGDTGSNVLGLTLGIMSTVITNLYIRLIILSSLIFIHIYAERKSISTFISTNRVLRSIDMLGRKKY